MTVSPAQDFGCRREFGIDHRLHIVSVVMGSTSDWPTMEKACEVLDELGISFETGVVSAHRVPKRLYEYSEDAYERNVRVIIAGAGGAAHLPGMIASMTTCPVLGVPIQSRALLGLDSLLSIVQMPGGVPVATFAIGESGAKNAALHAARTLAIADTSLMRNLQWYMERMRKSVPMDPIKWPIIGGPA
jgi:5-(carboxyamino)imidazole ribonucleotide mutase